MRRPKVEVNSQYKHVFQFRRNDDLIAQDFNPGYGIQRAKFEIKGKYNFGSSVPEER